MPFGVYQSRTISNSYYPYGESIEYSESAQVDYVAAGFHYFDNAAPLPGAALTLDAFRPFEQNYFYANFLSSGPPWLTCGQSCDSQGNNCTPLGIPYWPGGDWWVFEVDQPWNLFSVNAFVQSGMTNSISDFLSPDAAQWLCLNPGTETMVLETFGGQFQGYVGGGWAVSNDFPNLYGLNLQSVEALEWGNSNATLVTNYPGDIIPFTNTASFFDVARPQLSTIDYYFARSPVITLTPDPSGAYDDEVLTLVDPRPGEPGFTTSATTPLMIAPGQPLFLTAWAKQAITNGYSGKYAYLEQYFTDAYTIDGNGNVTTNSAGILSPYGEFFPMQPGPAALVTMPDIDTGQQGTGIVNVIKLQLDVNHDGSMDLSFAGPDNTSQARPFVFWINNDDDTSSSPSSPAFDPGKDRPITFPNPQYDYLNWEPTSIRDLEDYARLWICGLPALTNVGYQVTLSWSNVTKGSPAINLLRAVETNGGTLYITDTNINSLDGVPWQQISGYAGPGRKYSVTTTNALTLSSDWLTNAGNKYFLFEGAGTGSGQLVLTISQNSQILAQTGAWLDLHDIKDLYEQAHASNIDIAGPPSTNTSVLSKDYELPPNPSEEQQVIVYVHGMNNTVWNYQNTAETMLKRLYWQGYRGRFAAFYWPTPIFKLIPTSPSDISYLEFNRAEFVSWKSGAALKSYIDDLHNRLPGYTVNLAVHRLGNVAANEAIREGASVDNYALMQAAVSAKCFDGNNTNLDYTYLTSQESTKPTPDADAMGGYQNCFTNPCRRVNFYNDDDWALFTGPGNMWEGNQWNFKPDFWISAVGNTYYSFDGTNCYYMDYDADGHLTSSRLVIPLLRFASELQKVH